MGETPTTSISSEKTFAFSFTGKRSRTIALDATMPEQLPRACSNRSHINWSAEVAIVQPTEAMKYAVNPKYKGLFRPYRSSNGPYNICPNEIPMKKLESDNEIFATVVCRSAAIEGNPGRYISIENGPIADKRPNIKISLNFSLPFMQSYSFKIVPKEDVSCEL
ncbi:hypothetical protein SAE01_39210 [Segetibacter aerophilus]|uniref:Uncharacterized protein n=1 Tax=Segetibacter aerophilus TaxID=670293 RepID=A0A512BHS6_9BACT|nr:hypothetical protein SAE01_39210 [Segetibacter aerophilus]